MLGMNNPFATVNVSMNNQLTNILAKISLCFKLVLVAIDGDDDLSTDLFAWTYTNLMLYYILRVARKPKTGLIGPWGSLETLQTVLEGQSSTSPYCTAGHIFFWIVYCRQGSTETPDVNYEYFIGRIEEAQKCSYICTKRGFFVKGGLHGRNESSIPHCTGSRIFAR